MRILIVLILAVATGCGGSGYFLSFSNGYDPRTTLVNALPALALRPGETRKAMLSAPGFAFAPATGLVSEDPRVVIVWNPPRPNDIVHIQAVGPGKVLVHRGNFPFRHFKPGMNPVERASWRASLRKHLSPRPDDVAFRKISDEELWQTVVRSRSQGAIRIIVEDDHLRFWTPAE